jgi:acyl-[acyl-carrier-protein] desaturase
MNRCVNKDTLFPVCATTDAAMLHEMEPKFEALLNRHLATSRTWYPHEVVPRSERALTALTRSGWKEQSPALPEAVKSALFINVLTEDNLPYYTNSLLNRFEASPSLLEWVRRWTAEEGRHSIAIRDWIIATGAVNPWELEDARFEQVCRAVVPKPPSVADTLVYAAFQELATNIAHRNTGRALPSELRGKELMGLVAGDEMAHFRFYRDAVLSGLQVASSHMMNAIARQFLGFQMPGVGIPSFGSHARRVALGGIYDLAAYRELVMAPILNCWQLETVEGLDGTGEQARDAIRRHAGRLEALGKKGTARRADKCA